MQFCQANRRATQIIRSLPEYKAIVKYAPNVLRGALAIGVGNFFSVGTLYRKLRRYECDDCGDFAGYLFLLSCRRVCHFCLHYDMAYLPIYPGKARSHIQPRMTIVPGLYAMIGRRLDRLALIDRAFATPAERFIYHNRQTSKSWERPGHPLRYVSVVRAPWFNTAQGQAEWGFHCVGCSNLSRFPRHWRRKFTAATFKEHLEECGEITNGRHIDV
ncbi:F-box domain-containing protein [Podospora australis]|uniref:F-box domain-containing protein n=1 Tax=Podospora australis TaxID=1536484 RepID=A0AAN6X3I0_9PEZI|nr:F-box domain-containing protein [Podospora australis]